MFLERFLRARECLRQRGLRPQVVMGAPVSETEIKASEEASGSSMPSVLRQFYLELGDGFMFILDDGENPELIGWEAMHLEDHRICNKGFATRIEEEVTREIASGLPRTNPVLLREEMTRRKQWMPFYGFVGGGDYLCLDLSVTPSPVRFYEAVVWVAVANTWDFTVASSFSEFVERWSHYHFVSPTGGWTSYCAELPGPFDWAPQHFPLGREWRRELPGE